ncbi:MAG TPA: hypothetical protein VJI15_01495 [Candidatus Nanoarchaeia archaeon]|nr:hypothetical protein [Candidatus Nanoarchaeia archaeon]
MQSSKTAEEAYDRCIAENNLFPLSEIDESRVRSNLVLAKECFEGAKENSIKKRWNAGFISSYDVLHLLTESLLIFDKIKSRNHQCLFTTLCVKHQELELDWLFFEMVRAKRNGLHYYGMLITEKEWKSIELQLKLYISTLEKEVERKLKEAGNNTS